MTYNFRKSLPLFLLAAATISTSSMASGTGVIPVAEEHPAAVKVVPVAKHHETAAEGFANFEHEVDAGFKTFGKDIKKAVGLVDADFPTVYADLEAGEAVLTSLAASTHNPEIKTLAALVQTLINEVNKGKADIAVVKTNVAQIPGAATLVNEVAGANIVPVLPPVPEHTT